VAQSQVIQLLGAVTAQPAAPSFGSCSSQELLSLNLCQTYGAAFGGSVTVAGTTGSPGPLNLQGITKVRFFAIRLLSGATIQVKITTGLGVAIIPVSNLWTWSSPNPGDEITAIAFVTGGGAGGTQDIAYAIAGDVS
jgi:hypothetical protein